jgi:hypothetical protein
MALIIKSFWQILKQR